MGHRGSAAEAQFAGGGFSPLVSTFFCSVVVVDPSGVVTVVSVVFEASLSHPIKPSDIPPMMVANARNRFIFEPFYAELFAP